MEVRYLIRTGHYTQQLRSLKGRIRNLTRDRPEFYIGRTNNPENRARSHETSEPERWEQMAVLYETRSLNYSRQMERELIDHSWDNITNPIGGGGGPDGAPPYYIYILR